MGLQKQPNAIRRVVLALLLSVMVIPVSWYVLFVWRSPADTPTAAPQQEPAAEEQPAKPSLNGTITWSPSPNWYKSGGRPNWGLSVNGKYTRDPDDQYVVAIRKQMYILDTGDLRCKPYFMGDPRRKDDRTWWARNTSTTKSPYEESFGFGLVDLPEQFDALSGVKAQFCIRLAQEIGHVDIPIEKDTQWVEVTPGLKFRMLFSTTSEIFGDTRRPSTQRNVIRADIEFIEDYEQGGASFITVEGVFDNGGVGVVSRGGGGGSSRATGINVRRLGFMKERAEQELVAVRVHFAKGWEEQRIEVTLDNVPTPYENSPDDPSRSGR